MLVSLGARLRDADGADVDPCGATLASIASVDLDQLDGRLSSLDIVVATDVTNPLLGSHGAAAVFAPQKGATPEQVDLLEEGLAHWADVLGAVCGTDARDAAGSGAAGGTGLALIEALHARVISGARFVEDAIGLAEAISDADLVITGEGALDAQSAMGKGVGRVAELAREAGVPIAAVCGRIDPGAARALGLAAWATLDGHGPHAEQILRAVATVLARE